jgi:hypothetical protein
MEPFEKYVPPEQPQALSEAQAYDHNKSNQEGSDDKPF